MLHVALVSSHLSFCLQQAVLGVSDAILDEFSWSSQHVPLEPSPYAYGNFEAYEAAMLAWKASSEALGGGPTPLPASLRGLRCHVSSDY